MVDGIMYSCGCILIFRGKDEFRIENRGIQSPIYVDGRRGPRKAENIVIVQRLSTECAACLAKKQTSRDGNVT